MQNWKNMIPLFYIAKKDMLLTMKIYGVFIIWGYILWK